VREEGGGGGRREKGGGGEAEEGKGVSKELLYDCVQMRVCVEVFLCCLQVECHEYAGVSLSPGK